LLTAVLSGPAFAQEAADTDGDAQHDTDADAQPTPNTETRKEEDGPHNSEEPKEVEQPAPVLPAAPASEVAAPVAKPKFGDLSTSGYFRGGYGASTLKGRQTCFQLPNPQGLLSKYRLGNECEVWAEMQFTTVVYAGDDGSVAHLHFMPVAYIPTTYIGYSPTGVTSSDQGSPGTGATVAFPVLYADIQGIPWLFGGTAWIGTRYYKRESIYISDFFYWNPSGVGGGIEDVHLGKDMRLSYAVFAVDGQPSGSPQLPPVTDLGFRHDLQLRGIRPYPGGEFQVGLQYIADYSKNTTTHGGWGVTVRHVQQLLHGDNKLAFQYGRGGGTGFGTLARFYYPDFSLIHDTAESRTRLVDVLTIQPVDAVGAQVGLVYQHDDLGKGQKTDWYSAGARVSYGFTKYAKLLGEVGYDRAEKSNGVKPQWLAKFTIAPALSVGKGLMARPELRLFYTYAMWDETARGATVDSGQIYTNTNYLSGATFGMQAETWW